MQSSLEHTPRRRRSSLYTPPPKPRKGPLLLMFGFGLLYLWVLIQRRTQPDAPAPLDPAIRGDGLKAVVLITQPEGQDFSALREDAVRAMDRVYADFRTPQARRTLAGLPAGESGDTHGPASVRSTFEQDALAAARRLRQSAGIETLDDETLKALTLGLTVDACAKFLSESHVQGARVELGPIAYFLGEAKPGTPWTIQTPDPENAGTLITLPLRDQAVRVPPAGAVPKGKVHALVLAPTAAQAAGLGILLEALPPDEALALVESLEDADAILKTHDGRFLSTVKSRSGFQPD